MVLTESAREAFEHDRPDEAMWRNVAGLLRTIRGLGRGEVPYSELEPGDMIRLCGDWVTVVTLRSDRRMLVVDEDGTRSWYPVDEGETFLRGAL